MGDDVVNVLDLRILPLAVVAVVAIDPASDRHTELVEELTAVTNRKGIDFHCTG